MMNNIGAYMEAVARHYWGEPTKVRGHEMRWGTYGSKSVDKRKGTFYDHEHSVGGGVVDLVRLMEGATLSSLPDVLERKFGIPKRVQEGLRPAEFLSRIYDYFDEDGVLRYQVMRYEPKRFVQRHPLADDQWSYKMDGIEPLPFNLPAILANAHRPVFVAEGEKCAEALIRAGFVATTNHGGANNWNPSLNRWFAGRKVVVLPDNDVTGKAHAQRVVNNLLPVASEIKLCELPGLLPKGYISDWFNSGGTSEALTDLVKSSPVVQAAQEPVEEPAQPTGDVFPIYSVNHLTMMPPVEFLVEGLLPRNAFVVAYGLPGAGKSFFALDVAMSVAASRSWQGLATGSGAVLYIAGEGVGGIGKRIKGSSYFCDPAFFRLSIEINILCRQHKRSNWNLGQQIIYRLIEGTQRLLAFEAERNKNQRRIGRIGDYGFGAGFADDFRLGLNPDFFEGTVKVVDSFPGSRIVIGGQLPHVVGRVRPFRAIVACAKHLDLQRPFHLGSLLSSKSNRPRSPGARRTRLGRKPGPELKPGTHLRPSGPTAADLSTRAVRTSIPLQPLAAASCPNAVCRGATGGRRDFPKKP